jgi:hypothetical protein
MGQGQFDPHESHKIRVGLPRLVSRSSKNCPYHRVLINIYFDPHNSSRARPGVEHGQVPPDIHLPNLLKDWYYYPQKQPKFLRYSPVYQI